MMVQQQQPQGTTAPAPTTRIAAASVGRRPSRTTTTTTTALRRLVSSSVTLLLVVLLAWGPQLASGSSSSSSLGLCMGKSQACFLDEVCKGCLGSWSLDNVDDTCLADVAEVQSTSTGDCGTAGKTTCCGFEAGTSEECMANTLMVEYWACLQSGNGCDLDDIPCYGTVVDDEIQAASNGEPAGKMSPPGLLLASAAAAAAVAAAANAALV